MLDPQDNPQELMQSLDKFLSMFWGDYKVDIKMDWGETKFQKIPLPLKYLYSFVKRYPAPRNGYFFDTQDGLIFNSRTIYKNKLIIVSENQAVWYCATELEGIDPPVWVIENIEYANWKLVCNSLSQFLVTFILQESVFGSKYLYDVSLSELQLHDLDIIPLWNGLYPYRFTHNSPYSVSFYLIENSFLLMNGWCATNYRNADKLLTSFGYRKRR